MPDTSGPAQGAPFMQAALELEKVLTGFRSPADELFDRYLSKTEAEREAFVMALIGLVMLQRKRNHPRGPVNE